MLDGIRQQLLQRQHGQPVIQVFRGDIDIEKELVGIAYLEQVSVGFGETQLLRERRQHVLTVADDIAKREGELVDVGECLLFVALAHEHRQRIERIEEEVGVDLAHQHVVARREVLAFELFVLDLHRLPLTKQPADLPVQEYDDQRERTLHDQVIVEPAAAERQYRQLVRPPTHDRGDEIEPDGKPRTQQTAFEKSRHRPHAVAQPQERKQQESQHEEIEELQREDHPLLRTFEDHSVIERLAVAFQHLSQHEPSARTVRFERVGQQMVARPQPQEARRIAGDIDAVARRCDLRESRSGGITVRKPLRRNVKQIAVPVGRNPHVAFDADNLPIRPQLPAERRMPVVALFDHEQQHVGEIDHQ